jgi:hypothetical protein
MSTIETLILAYNTKNDKLRDVCLEILEPSKPFTYEDAVELFNYYYKPYKYDKKIKYYSDNNGKSIRDKVRDIYIYGKSWTYEGIMFFIDKKVITKYKDIPEDIFTKNMCIFLVKKCMDVKKQIPNRFENFKFYTQLVLECPAILKYISHLPYYNKLCVQSLTHNPKTYIHIKYDKFTKEMVKILIEKEMIDILIYKRFIDKELLILAIKHKRSSTNKFENLVDDDVILAMYQYQPYISLPQNYKISDDLVNRLIDKSIEIGDKYNIYYWVTSFSYDNTIKLIDAQSYKVLNYVTITLDILKRINNLYDVINSNIQNYIELLDKYPLEFAKVDNRFLDIMYNVLSYSTIENNVELLWIIIKHNPKSAYKLNGSLTNEMMCYCIDNNVYDFSQWRDNKDVAKYAFSRDMACIKYVDDECISIEMAEMAMNTDPKLYRYIPNELKTLDMTIKYMNSSYYLSDPIVNSIYIPCGIKEIIDGKSASKK